MNKRFNEASEHGGESSRSRISRLSEKELKLITVKIKRRNVPESTASGPLQRSLEKPEDLHVHRLGEGEKPIFDRDDVVVNKGEYLEERVVLKSPIRDLPGEGTSRRSRSKSYSDRGHSRESYSSINRRSYSRSRSKSRKESDRQTKEYERGLKSPTREKQHTERKRSVSPHYKRGETDRYDYKSRALSEKYYRDRSPRAGTSRGGGGGERERSKERRDSESYRKDKYKVSPRRPDYRESPKRYERNRSQSPSHRKLNYKSLGSRDNKDKYSRARTPPAASKRHSISPHRKRSPSPYFRKHSPSPHSRRRSRSPHFKRTPPREERTFGGSSGGSKTRRRSGSPYERDKSRSGYSKPTYPKRRTPSPYSRRHSRSPHRSRKHSRSPSRRETYSHAHRRSRSPYKVHKHSESDERYKSEYKGVTPDFRYYGPEGYWVPGPIPRPGFIPRGPLIPPSMGMPRGVFGPEPYLFTRPYLPIPPHAVPPFRPRFPQYNRPYRPRLSAPSTSSVTSTITSTTNAVATTSTAVTSTNPIIEEPAEPVANEMENTDSTEKS